jgi:diacylglycerol kinase
MRRYLVQRAHSCRYAFRGIVFLLRSQANAQIHLIAALAVAVLAWCVQTTAIESALLAAAIGMVWMAEAINTALEQLVDLVSPERHPLAGRVKDIAAGAVLLVSFIAVIIGGFVFVPRI